MSCPICFNNYNKDYIPIILTCGHTFCKVCIKKLNKIICPICRKLHKISELIINYEIYNDRIQSIYKDVSLVEFLRKDPRYIAETISELYNDKKCKFSDGNILDYFEVLETYLFSDYMFLDNKKKVIELLDNKIIESLYSEKGYVKNSEVFLEYNILFIMLWHKNLNDVSKYILCRGIETKTMTPLEVCCKSYNIEMIEYFLYNDIYHEYNQIIFIIENYTHIAEKLLIENKIKDINCNDGYNRTSLWYLSDKKDKYNKIFDLILKHPKVNINIKVEINYQNIYPLSRAIYCKDEYKINKLLSHNNLDAKIYCDNCDIINSLIRYNLKYAEMLLSKKNFKINLRNKRKLDPILNNLIEHDVNCNIFKHIIKNNNIDINYTIDDIKYSPFLIEAIQYNNINIVKFLLENNVDVNKKDVYGDIPLVMSVQKNNYEIIELLLNHQNTDTKKLRLGHLTGICLNTEIEIDNDIIVEILKLIVSSVRKQTK